jgi:S-DNA-T family DNA segregation ATPase FtsK/SpoIIIE
LLIDSPGTITGALLIQEITAMKQWVTPTMQYYSLYADMLRQTHLLVAGATGSGKSVVINGIITTSLQYSPEQVQYILIDPKRVEMIEYKPLPHTIAYASEPDSMVQALQRAMNLIEGRYSIMQRQHVKKYQGSNVYIVIDELADLMTTNKKQVQPLIQRIAQIGRAANVHIIAATQCPLSAVIPTPIKVNFDSRVGLRTRSKQDSRNILGCGGCECLPSYGQGYYMTAQGIELYKIPMYSRDTVQGLLDYWKHQIKPHISLFHRH